MGEAGLGLEGLWLCRRCTAATAHAAEVATQGPLESICLGHVLQLSSKKTVEKSNAICPCWKVQPICLELYSLSPFLSVHCRGQGLPGDCGDCRDCPWGLPGSWGLSHCYSQDQGSRGTPGPPQTQALGTSLGTRTDQDWVGT